MWAALVPLPSRWVWVLPSSRYRWPLRTRPVRRVRRPGRKIPRPGLPRLRRRRRRCGGGVVGCRVLGRVCRQILMVECRRSRLRLRWRVLWSGRDRWTLAMVAHEGWVRGWRRGWALGTVTARARCWRGVRRLRRGVRSMTSVVRLSVVCRWRRCRRLLLRRGSRWLGNRWRLRWVWPVRCRRRLRRLLGLGRLLISFGFLSGMAP